MDDNEWWMMLGNPGMRPLNISIARLIGAMLMECSLAARRFVEFIGAGL